MAFFIIFSPFIICAGLLMVAGAATSLFAGAAAAIALVAYDFWLGRTIKLLAAGTAMTFSALGCYLMAIDGEWSHISVRVAINISVLAIALFSVAIKEPFTIQYAREQVEPAVTRDPGFIRVNYILTWTWIGAIVLMLMSNLLMLTIPAAPLWIGLAATFALRNAAVTFTKLYTEYWIAKAGPEHTGA
ncbi:hypothetical protein X566_24375 [Afipia sp. P52-10]|uniref:hypothetical protein n=1 Tax=Afipia sp. P52-10 TaxID=1429916 RepID=UPI0003DF11FD|nr:hypothetical protein [Afipia sp. P52-10]ETR75801.1 hypothetical protein X566_24375 [Afipia sp. P52-10]